MRMIKERVNTLVVVTLFLLVLLGMILTIRNVNVLSFQALDSLTKGIIFILIVNGSFIVKDLKSKSLLLGTLFVAAYELIDFMITLDLSLLNDHIIMINIIADIVLTIGIIYFVYGLFFIVLSQNQILEQMKHMAYYDQLTHLPNRNYILNQTHPLVGDDLKVYNYAVLFIDLDDFKFINDNLGHDFGDKVLQEIAKRLIQCIHSKDIVSRLSGDEFLIIIKDYGSLNSVEVIARFLIKRITEPIMIANRHIHVTCSIGISLFPKDGETLETLTKHADLAMYKAKQSGKNNYYVFEETIGLDQYKKFEIIEEFRHALVNNEFVLYFQPKAKVNSHVISGLEVLVRWNNPKRGLLFPNEFIPIAEETGLIKELDKIVMLQTCEQITQWMKEGHEPINVSINISPLLFKENKFITIVDDVIEETCIDTSLISFEITEGISIDDVAHTIDILKSLKKRGIQVVLDDFGKGYSSLTYIKDFPIDVLKIDKTFIDGIGLNKKDEALIETIISMSQLLGIKVVSEGVETNKQLEFLQQVGCDEYQGYILSKPKPVEEIIELLDIGISKFT